MVVFENGRKKRERKDGMPLVLKAMSVARKANMNANRAAGLRYSLTVMSCGHNERGRVNIYVNLRATFLHPPVSPIDTFDSVIATFKSAVDKLALDLLQGLALMVRA